VTSRIEYLTRQRWFARHDGEVTLTHIQALPWLREPTDGLGVRFELLTVTVDGLEQVYNVPASYRSEPFPGLENAAMEFDGKFFIYDAMLDAHARTELLAGFFDTAASPITYDLATPLEVGPLATTVPLIAEQSNTSVIVGNRYLLKLFRKVAPGRNPDIEISRALTEHGTDYIAKLHGWISADDIDLAMIYDYYSSASDGWDFARASFRDLLAEPDLSAGQVGGDFSGESRRLGKAVAEVHALMADLGAATWSATDLTALVSRFRQRFDEAAAVNGSLDDWRVAAFAAYAELTHLDEPVVIQRVHGDLHLGQTLRTVEGWKLIDFEGEPAKPLADRIRPDSPLRDVAGMLRSFDYAPHSVLLQTGASSASAQEAATQWSIRNQEAFLDGYGITPGKSAYALLRCYQIDKAVYEVAYETQHRPTWVDIPLGALGRLLAQ